MMFTALESALFAGLISTVVAIIVRVRSVSPRECDQHRTIMAENLDRTNRLIEEAQRNTNRLIEEMQRSNEIQKKMLLCVITHLNLSPEAQQKIMNMGSEK